MCRTSSASFLSLSQFIVKAEGSSAEGWQPHMTMWREALAEPLLANNRNHGCCTPFLTGERERFSQLIWQLFQNTCEAHRHRQDKEAS